jgi:hypothetical protein
MNSPLMEVPRLIQAMPSVGEVPAEGPSHALQQLWFATRRREWSSLAVIPIEPRSSARFVAEALAEVGELHRGAAVKLIDAEGATVAASSRIAVTLVKHVAAGGIGIALLDPVVQNQAGIPIALVSDAILLAVELGVAASASMQRTLELLGRDRVIGTVAIQRRGR